MLLFFCTMSGNSKNIQELLTRCKLPIPFGNKDEWERFAQTYIPCCILIQMYDDPAEYQRKIFKSFLIGKGCITIWSEFISLAEQNERTGLNRIIKALVDGHMGVYGYENIKFDNIEKSLNNYISNEGKNNDSHIAKYGLHLYKYRIVSTLIDETSQGYDIKAELYQEPLADHQFDDLLEYGIYSTPRMDISDEPKNKEPSINFKNYGPIHDFMMEMNKTLNKDEINESN